MSIGRPGFGQVAKKEQDMKARQLTMKEYADGYRTDESNVVQELARAIAIVSDHPDEAPGSFRIMHVVSPFPMEGEHVEEIHTDNYYDAAFPLQQTTVEVDTWESIAGIVADMLEPMNSEGSTQMIVIVRK